MELSQIDSNIIIALGENVLWAFTNNRAIKKLRGSIYQVTLPNGKEVKVIATYSPASVNLQWELGAIMEYDLRKAIKESSTSQLHIKKHSYILSPSEIDILTYLEGVKQAGIVSYDIETSPGRGILCISFSHTPTTAISIPTTVEYWGSYEKLLTIIRLIKEFLTCKGRKVGQNILYDNQYIARFFHILPSDPWEDTMILQHSAYPEFPKGLDFLTSIYTDIPYYKDELKIWQEGKVSEEKLWSYNAKDSAITLECYYELMKEVESLGDLDTYRYTMSLLKPTLYMILTGFKVDFDVMREKKKKFISDLTKSKQAFKDEYDDINLNSPKQLIDLCKKLKIKIPTMKGKETMNEKAIEKLSKKHPAFREILNFRKANKVISTYLEAPLDGVDGRMKFSLNPAGTTTGRFSSSSSVFYCGTNFQNFPKHLRSFIIPDEGMVFTEADLKGAEAMIMAYLTGDILLIDLFERGENIHNFTATKIIWPGMTDDDIKKDKEEMEAQGLHTKSKYFIAKKVRHGGNYLLSWRGLADQLEIPASEAKKLLQRFYDNSPNLTMYHNSIEEQLRRTRTITTPFGRRRTFYGRMGPDLVKKAVAYVPQETVSRVLNLGIVNLYNNLCSRYHDVHIKNQVHDSILLMHPAYMTDTIHRKIRENFKIPIVIKGRVFTIGIDIKTGNNWGEL